MNQFLEINGKNLYELYVIDMFEDIPITFICIDDDKKLYFCLCSEIRYRTHWTIAPCTKSKILDLFKGEISLYNIFDIDEKLYSVDYYNEESGIQVQEKNIKDISVYDLPDRHVSCDYEHYLKEILDIFKDYNINL